MIRCFKFFADPRALDPENRHKSHYLLQVFAAMIFLSIGIAVGYIGGHGSSLVHRGSIRGGE